MSKQIQIGDRVIWSSGNGSAHRVRNFDGSKSNPARYVAFNPADIYTRRTLRARRPRLSRKGNPISGTLPRLTGY